MGNLTKCLDVNHVALAAHDALEEGLLGITNGKSARLATEIVLGTLNWNAATNRPEWPSSAILRYFLEFKLFVSNSKTHKQQEFKLFVCYVAVSLCASVCR